MIFIPLSNLNNIKAPTKFGAFMFHDRVNLY